MLNSVLLPQPLGPTTVTNSPGATATSSPCSAVTDPNVFDDAARLQERRLGRGGRDRRRGLDGRFSGQCRQRGPRESCIMKTMARMRAA